MLRGVGGGRSVYVRYLIRSNKCHTLGSTNGDDNCADGRGFACGPQLTSVDVILVLHHIPRSLAAC